MDINTLRGLITLVLMLTFIGIWIWAWSAKRKKDFEEAANLPFRDEQAGDTAANGKGDVK